MPDSPDRRTQLREAALQVFARKGYRNAVVEDVAAEAGVAKGTVYTYFDRKEELLGAVFEGHLEELRARQDEILESDRLPLEKIRALHHGFADLLGEDDAFARVLLDIWTAGMQDPERFGIDFKTLYAEYRALVRQLLEEAEAQGDIRTDLPQLTPAVLIGAIEGVLLQWVLDPEGVEFPEAADDVIDVLYRGVRRPDSS
jgi:TetR/AcrR family fatty acid metabolism transcriptional regulator